MHLLQQEQEQEQHQQPTLSGKAAGRLHLAALVVSWCSLLFSFSTGVVALVLGCIDKSEALFGYGLDATLDGLSSVAVLWRFYGSVSVLYSQDKERKACIVIGSLFVLSGLLLTAKSVHAVIVEIHESKAVVLYTTFALITGITSVVLALVKIYVGYRLQSEAMATDSIITFVGAAMSFAGVVGLELYVQNTHLWFMDSVFGIICGLFLIIFGIKLLYEMLNRKHSHEELQ